MTPPQPHGYLANPPSGKGSAVLVLHAWWGLNDTMRSVCDRLAQAGFTAFAPDLFGGRIARTVAEADALSSAHEGPRVKSAIVEAVAFLRDRADDPSGLAVVGFSFGAYYALDLSIAEAERVRSVVLFYGTGGGDFSKSRAEYLGHFAENDEYEPQAQVDRLATALSNAGRPVTFHRYAGTGHWFFEPDRSDAYNHEAASLAWDRTLAFLRGRASDDSGGQIV